jgi:hypothetical protein
MTTASDEWVHAATKERLTKEIRQRVEHLDSPASVTELVVLSAHLSALLDGQLSPLPINAEAPRRSGISADLFICLDKIVVEADYLPGFA